MMVTKKYRLRRGAVPPSRDQWKGSDDHLTPLQRLRLPDTLTDESGQQVYDATGVAALIKAIMEPIGGQMRRGDLAALLFLHSGQFARLCALSGADWHDAVDFYRDQWPGRPIDLATFDRIVAMHGKAKKPDFLAICQHIAPAQAHALVRAAKGGA